MTRRLPGLFSLTVVAAALVLLVGGCGGFFGDDEPAAQPSPVPAPSEAGADLTRYYEQTLNWQGCGDGFECDDIEVPLDYDDPAAESIALALVRLPARDGSARVGSLLVNPGGPGGSGVAYARQAETAFTEPLLDAYDIIGFDPRGVAASTPVDCLTDHELDIYVASEATPDDIIEIQGTTQQAKTFVDGCAAKSARLLPHVGTTDAARDMDIIRALVGDEQLNYLGASYGTYLGAVYAELFPDRVGRLVLDGALSTTADIVETGRQQALAFEVALDAFLADCAEQDDCPLPNDPAEARAEMQQLLDELDAEPLDVGSRQLTEALGFLGILVTLYDDLFWPALRAGLGAAFEGEGGILLELADIYLDRQPDGTYEGNQNESNPAVSCYDRPLTRSVTEIAQDADRFSAESPFFGEWLGWGSLSCALWPADARGSAPVALRATGAAAILVIGTVRDPATPYVWAVEMAEQLESGVLLTFDGDGHTAYNRGSDCIDSTVEDYLVSGTIPEDGRRC
ncbi:MAG: alpha/beta hydrolase [Candidatus Nanopelagicales bacterium]